MIRNYKSAKMNSKLYCLISIFRILVSKIESLDLKQVMISGEIFYNEFWEVPAASQLDNIPWWGKNILRGREGKRAFGGEAKIY